MTLQLSDDQVTFYKEHGYVAGVPVSQLLEGLVCFWHDQLFCKLPRHGGGVAGIRNIRTGPGLGSRWIGLMTPPVTTGACITKDESITVYHLLG